MLESQQNQEDQAPLNLTQEERQRMFSNSVSALALSDCALGFLDKAKIETIGELVKYSETELTDCLIKIKHGSKRLVKTVIQELQDELSRVGLSFGLTE